jgi:hypothetical protein
MAFVINVSIGKGEWPKQRPALQYPLPLTYSGGWKEPHGFSSSRRIGGRAGKSPSSAKIAASMASSSAVTVVCPDGSSRK